MFDLVATLGRTPNAGIDREDRGVDKQQTLTFNDKNISEFRASHGRIASFGDAPLLLLTTAGARSGQRRTDPMMYLADEHDPEPGLRLCLLRRGRPEPGLDSTTSSLIPTTSRWS